MMPLLDFAKIRGHSRVLIAALALLLVAVPVVRSLAGGEVVRSRFRVSVDLVIDGYSGHGEGVWEVHMDDELTRFGSRAYYKTRVFGEAIEVPLEDGRVALVLRRNAAAPPNFGYGAFIIDCLVGATSLDDRPAALREFDGGCAAHDRKPMVVIVGKDGELVRTAYKRADGSGPIINSISIASHVTNDVMDVNILDKYPWIKSFEVAFEANASSKTLWWDRYYVEDFLMALPD